MHAERRARISRVVALCLALGGVSSFAIAVDISFVVFDSTSDPVIVVARDAGAGAGGDLFGDAAGEWVASIDGVGIVVRSGDDGSLRMIPGLEARALAIAQRRLYAASSEGILEFDFDADTTRWVAARSAVALAAVDFDADGIDEIAASLENGQLVLLDLDADQTFGLGHHGAVALAGGDALGRRTDQLAVLGAGGGVAILDEVQGDVTLCYLGAIGASATGACRSRGLAVFPGGRLIATLPCGELVALDPSTCEIASVDLSESDVQHEEFFTSIRETADVELPPCPISGVACRPVPERDSLLVTWEAREDPNCDCERFIVDDAAGRELGSVPGDENALLIPCARLGDASPVTVTCIGPNGERTSASCDFEPCARPGGDRIPGDCNQDAGLDLSDAICLLGHLFLGNPTQLPCGDGRTTHPANAMLLDSNGDRGVDLSDPVYVLTYLFLGGAAPALGDRCVPIPDCADRCALAAR